MPGSEWKETRMEARGRIELPIKVLQTFALPLGDRALEKPCPKNKKPTIQNRGRQELRANCENYRLEPSCPQTQQHPQRQAVSEELSVIA